MVDFGVLSQGAQQQSDKDGFRILILGNASGSATQLAGSDLKDCKIRFVDRDNLEDVLVDMGISVAFEPLVPGGPTSELEITSLDDFHPDNIFDNLAAFGSLRQLKRQLAGGNPAQAIEEIKSWSEQSTDGDPSIESAPQQGVAEAEVTRENWFEHVLETSQETDSENSASVDWQKWVRDTIEPMSIVTVDPDIDACQSIVDKAIEISMRRVLTHPVFQRCESYWRGVDFLVRRVDSDVDVKVALLNCDVNQLVADVNTDRELVDSSLYQRLVVQTVGTPGGKPWSIVGCSQPFDLNTAHVQAMGRIGKIAAAAGSAVLTTAHFGSPNWNSDDCQNAWSELQGLENSSSIAALTPRFLLRLPYGKKGGRVERFQFEESSELINHLWGSPVWLAGSMLIRAHEQTGNVDTTRVYSFEGLPMHEYSSPDLGDAYVSGETLYSESQLAAWIESGVTPLVSFKDSDRISINGFQSVSRKPWLVT